MNKEVLMFFGSTQRTTAVLMLVGVLFAAVAADAQSTASVTIGDVGLVTQNGTALVPVMVTCDGGDVLEALLTLSQDDQFIYGQGSLGAVTCDGTTRRSVARVRATDGRFHRGEAYASAYVLICAGEACISASDSTTIHLIGRR